MKFRPIVLSLAVCISFLGLVPSALAQADLAVSKSGPFTADVDTDVSFDVMVFNFGADDASTVKLKDPLPPGMTFVSANLNSGAPFDCSSVPAVGTNGTITCTLATFTAGSSADFTFVAHIPPATPKGTTFTNTATISSATPDPNSENDSSTTAVMVPIDQADIGVQKVGPSSAAPNTDVAYTITVNNAGPKAAANFSLTDTLPGTMTFVSMVQNGVPTFDCSPLPSVGSGGTVKCTIASLDSGVTTTFTLTGHIPPGTASGTTFSNTAKVNSDTNDPNPDNNSSLFDLIVNSSDLAITKTGPATASAGAPISWTITASNNGPDASSPTTFNDPLPAGTTFVSIVQNPVPTFVCNDPGAGNNGSVSCTIGNFASGASAQFTLTANINANFTGTLSNTATISGPNADTKPNNNSATASTTVPSNADLMVTKTGPAAANAGSNVTYSITLTNNGPSPALNVSLTDAVPANTTFVSESQTTGPVFSCTTPAAGGTGSVSCSLATLANGASATFSITVHISSGASGTISNTANAATTSTDSNLINNSSTASTTVTSSADLSVTKTGAASAAAGSNLTYTITVTNNGPSDATTVTLADALPANTTFVSESQTTGPAFSCTTPSAGGTGTVTCMLATLINGASATFSVTVHINSSATGTVSNTANVTTTSTDSNASNNSSTATTTLTTSADIGVVKTASPFVLAGANITYNITVTNNGPSDSGSVTMADTLPPNTTFVSESQPTGPAFVCVNPAVGGTGTVSCTIAALTSGTSATFSIVVQVSSSATAGPSSNTATVTSANDPNAANNSSTASTTVTSGADLGVVKTAAASAAAGSNLTYTITVTNNGPSDATTVTLTDALPANTTFVSESQTTGPAFSCTTPSAGGTGTVTCMLATLINGASATFSLTVHINSNATGTVSNTANVTTTSTDSNASNNTSTATTTLTTSADIGVVKTASAFVLAGANLTYNITVTNNGTSDSGSVTMADTLPPNTTFVSESQPTGPAFVCVNPAVGGTGTVSCSIATLTSGTSATFSIVVQVSSSATFGPSSNTATVTSANDPNAANNSSTAVTSIVTAAIPIVSPLALLLLAMVLAAAGALVLKR